MQIVLKKIDLEQILDLYRKQGKIIGFVPTMGALHEGHISLIKTSKKNSDITVCSIFVNPTQFNDKSDLEKYPRMPDKDIAILEKAECDVLFMPTVHEIYPNKGEHLIDVTTSSAFNFGNLDKIWDGALRKGHFNGVARVVSILMDIVKPDKAFFGQKDYQQLLIIKELTRQLKLNIEVVACDTVRDSDGLAMSSRNMLLSGEERVAASLLPKLMSETKTLKEKGKSVNEISTYFKDQLKNNLLYKLDYFAICNSENLAELLAFDKSIKPIALMACFVGKIRLIDNLFLD